MTIDPLGSVLIAAVLIAIAYFLMSRRGESAPGSARSRVEVGAVSARIGEVITIFDDDEDVIEPAPLPLFTRSADTVPAVAVKLLAAQVAPQSTALVARGAVLTVDMAGGIDIEAVLRSIPRTTVPGGGPALFEAPSDLRFVLAYMRKHQPGGKYLWPVGWYLSTDDGKPRLVWTSLKGEANHFLISGTTNSGKDNLARYGIYTLCLQHTPQEIQFAIMDGKGLDWLGFSGKAHTWGISLSHEFHDALASRITREMRVRQWKIQQTGVRSWDDYKGGDMPMLVILVSELYLIAMALGQSGKSGSGKDQLKNWLTPLVTAGRAFGMRVIVLTQSATNMPTEWRGQLNTYLAGAQPAPNHDEPNTGLRAENIKAKGGVPPSEMPSVPTYAGVVTYVQGMEVGTVRSGFVTDEQIDSILAGMPDAPTELNTAKMPTIEEDGVKQAVKRVGAKEAMFDLGDYADEDRRVGDDFRGAPSASYFNEELPVLLAQRPRDKVAVVAESTEPPDEFALQVHQIVRRLQSLSSSIDVSPRSVSKLLFDAPTTSDELRVKSILADMGLVGEVVGKTNALAALVVQHKRKLDTEYTTTGVRPSRRALFKSVFNTDTAPGGRRWNDLKAICDSLRIYVAEVDQGVMATTAALATSVAAQGAEQGIAQEGDAEPQDPEPDEQEGVAEPDERDEVTNQDTEYWMHYVPPDNDI